MTNIAESSAKQRMLLTNTHDFFLTSDAKIFNMQRSAFDPLNHC
jgi:hypothetical protein